MKKGSLVTCALVAGSILFINSAKAEDLIQVYQQALRNDPTFAQARANWQSAKMNLPIAQSRYLPQLTIESSGSRNYSEIEPTSISTIRNYFWKYGYSVTLEQPIFALPIWESIKEASATVKAATASYLAAQQSLMARTTEAYFNVLKRYNILRYTIANKKAVYGQLESARETFKAGLIAITDVYDAKSRYDIVSTQQITAENNLDIALEKLRAITGHYYNNLKGLRNPVPLTVPKPNNIDAWMHVAEQENYNIQSQNFNVIAAMNKIKRVSSEDIPTVSMSGSFSETQNKANSGNRTTVDASTLELNMTYKPIQGGFVHSSTQQAKYDYTSQAAKLEEIHRQVTELTRSSFLSILSGIRRIKSDQTSIASSQKALDATQAGLKVGTRTMVDVLDDLSDLYQNKQQYVDDQYNYLNNIIQLKNASGRLSMKDLVSINNHLQKYFKLSTKKISS